MDTETRRRAAGRLLAGYLKAAFQGAGLRWDSDNTAEAEDIIDIIFEEIADVRRATEAQDRQAKARAQAELDYDAWRTHGPDRGQA